jgi:uncharacterized protein involved in outer membrane biogenesis
MNPTLISRLPSLKKAALVVAGSIAALLLFLWLALPGIIQSRAEEFVREKSGHRLTLDRPQFNPFRLELRLANLKLSDPEGKPLLGFRELDVDLSASSLPRRAAVFDAIRLDGLEVALVELPGGTINWSRLIAAFQDKEDKTPPAGLPRFDIQSFVLADGRLDYADRRSAQGFATRVEHLNLSLSDISTLPDDSGKFKLEARTSTGAQLALTGALDLNPVAVSGTFSLQALQLGQFAPYLGDFLAAAPAGVAAVTASYRAGNTGDKLDVKVEGIEASLSGLRLPLGAAGNADGNAGLSVGTLAVKGGSFDLAKQVLSIGSIALGDTRLELPKVDRSLELSTVTLEGARIDLAGRQAAIASLTLADGSVFAVRKPEGQIFLLEGLKALAAIGNKKKQGAPTAQDAAPDAPWRFRLDQVNVTGLDVFMRDEGVTPALEIGYEKITLNVKGVSEDLGVALPVQLAFNVTGGGRFEGGGNYTPAGPVVDFKIKLADLALKLVEPLLASKTTLLVADGRLSTQGQVSYGAKGAEPGYRGDFSVRDLRLKEQGSSEDLLAWKNLATQQFTVTPTRLDIGELRLNGLDTKLIINKDKSINLMRVLKSPPPTAPAPAAAVPAATPAEGAAASPAADAAPAPVAAPAAATTAAAPYLVNIDRLRFFKGDLDFADLSLMFPFATRIHGLRGSIGNLSSRPGAPGQLELDGEVDEFGMARAVGQVDLFNPTDNMDIKVIFRNVDMSRLTPYMATFAGRRIESGKLSLDLEYKIKKRQLQGENKVVIDRLTLGERVESPTATSLPLDLAIAILQDSDGRIDLGLPVAGSLDDPEFSYGGLVWKAITNVLTKIVTAPFRALGALFGGSGEKIESIAFEPGARQLTPPEREKLLKIAAVLGKRPKLALAVGGVHAEVDRVALQEVQLRRAVLTQSGLTLSERGDPGPISIRQPKIQAALETLYADRVGKSELAALKEGFRNANPGQLEEGVGDKVMSRLSGLMREKKTLNEGEVAQLKGADFYAVLFERLREKEKVGDDILLALAQARGTGAVDILKANGVAPERLQLLPPQKGESTGDGVPIKLSLEAEKDAGKEN